MYQKMYVKMACPDINSGEAKKVNIWQLCKASLTYVYYCAIKSFNLRYLKDFKLTQ